MKYRYIMNGTFTPRQYEYRHKGTDQRILCIGIPSPYSHDSESEAMKDERFSYRFVASEGGVRIAVYPGEDFKVDIDKNGRKCFKTWTIGNPLHYYNYEEFKALGGIIYEMPGSMMCSLPDGLSEDEMIARLETWKSETMSASWKISDYETDASFDELFPDLTSEDRPIYIDDEAYFIAEEESIASNFSQE